MKQIVKVPSSLETTVFYNSGNWSATAAALADVQSNNGDNSYIYDNVAGSINFYKFSDTTSGEIATLQDQLIMGVELGIVARADSTDSTVDPAPSASLQFIFGDLTDTAPTPTRYSINTPSFTIDNEYKTYSVFCSSKPFSSKCGKTGSSWQPDGWLASGIGLDNFAFGIELQSVSDAVTYARVTYVYAKIVYRSKTTLADELGSERSIPFQWVEMEGIPYVPTTHLLTPTGGEYANDPTVGSYFFGVERKPVAGTLYESSGFRSGGINYAKGQEKIENASVRVADVTEYSHDAIIKARKFGHPVDATCVARYTFENRSEGFGHYQHSDAGIDHAKYRVQALSAINNVDAQISGTQAKGPVGSLGPYVSGVLPSTIQNNTFTLAAWIWLDTSSNNQSFVWLDRAGANSYSLWLWYDFGYITFYTDGFGALSSSTSFSGSPSQWHHIVITAAPGDKMVMYIDGQLQAKIAVSSGSTITYNTPYLYIGSDNYAGIKYGMNSYIAELAFYSVAKSRPWVQSRFQDSKRYVFDTPEYNEQTHQNGFYSNLFAFGDRSNGAETQLSEEIDPLEYNTLSVVDTSDFPTANTNASYMYINKEAIWYGSKRSSPDEFHYLAGLTARRGRFSSSPFSRHLQNRAIQLYPTATSVPKNWIGRWVKLWIGAIDLATGLPYPQQLSIGRMYILDGISNGIGPGENYFNIALGPAEKMLDREVFQEKSARIQNIDLSDVDVNQIGIHFSEPGLYNPEYQGQAWLVAPSKTKYNSMDELLSNINNNIFSNRQTGATRPSTTIAVNVAAHATSVTVTSSAGFTANNALHFISTNRPGSSNACIGETAVITGVAGNVLNLQYPVMGSYPSGQLVVKAGIPVGQWSGSIEGDRVIFKSNYPIRPKLALRNTIAKILGFADKDETADVIDLAPDNDMAPDATADGVDALGPPIAGDGYGPWVWTAKNPYVHSFVCPSSSTITVNADDLTDWPTNALLDDDHQQYFFGAIKHGDNKTIVALGSSDGIDRTTIYSGDAINVVWFLSSDLKKFQSSNRRQPIVATGDDQATIVPVLASLTTPDVLLARLLTSTGDNGNNIAGLDFDSDKFPHGFGLGIDAELLDPSGMLALRSQVYPYRSYYLESPISPRSIIDEEVEFPSAIVFGQDGEGRFSFRTPSARSLTDVSGLITVSDQDLIDGSTVTTVVNTKNIVNRAIIECNHNPFTDKFERTISASEQSSIEAYGEKKRSSSHRGVRTVLMADPFVNSGLLFDSFSAHTESLFQRFAFEIPVITLQVGPKGLALKPGDAVRLSVATAYNPYDATGNGYSATNRVFEVTQVDKNDFQGSVNLELIGDNNLSRLLPDVDPGRFVSYAPSAKITSWAAGTNTATIAIDEFSSNDAAYFSVNNVCVMWQASNGSGGDDPGWNVGAGWAAGHVHLQITAITHNPTNSQITFNQAPDNAPSANDIICYTIYNNQNSSQQNTAFGHFANSSTDTVNTGVSTYIFANG